MIHEKILDAYETAQRKVLDDRIRRGAEAFGRLRIYEHKTQADFEELVRSIATAKEGYREFLSFGFRDESVRIEIERLEFGLRQIESREENPALPTQ
jgi:hypothetical protein